ncbi:MAG: hypothetical protein CBD47_07635 [Synechococcus sp. TMED187]|nr:MAG: hypothetical protein CBD47_07635 [Synechococcus sp. TMED187]
MMHQEDQQTMLKLGADHISYYTLQMVLLQQQWVQAFGLQDKFILLHMVNHHNGIQHIPIQIMQQTQTLQVE